MDSEKLITVMEKLLKLHRSLLDLSERKTAVVTKGDMDALNKLLKDEQAHIAAISKLDNDRQKMACELVPGTDKPTINDCIEVLVGEQKEKLEELRSELTDTINMIQEKNELNQQLVYQSLQFVNFSLNLVAPQPETINYGPEAGKRKNQGPGMFNTRA